MRSRLPGKGHWRFLGAVAGLAALALVSCGGTAGTTTSPPETAPPTKAPALATSSSSPTATTATTATTPTTRPATSTTTGSTPISTTTIPPPTVTSVPGTEVPVVSVTDGDTIRVLVRGTDEPVRLIGINSPESGECLYEKATAYMKDLLSAGTVRLESDVSDRDQYGRLLRYVFVGDVFVNEAMVRQGLAIARRYEPDVAQADRLEAAQAAAEADGVGMWDPSACGTEAAGTLEIGQIHYDAQGNDNDNLNDEWVELTNPGPGSIDLTGWEIKDESASHRYPFPGGFTLAADATVRLYTGCGTDAATALYWCNQGSAVWNNSGDTVFVLDPNGNVVTEKSYSG